MVMLLAGLQSIPRELYERRRSTARISFQEFRYITFPQLRGVLATIALLDFDLDFPGFRSVFVMTGGGPRSSQVLATSIYFNAFQKFQFGYASAEAVAMFVLLMVGSIASIRRAVPP